MPEARSTSFENILQVSAIPECAVVCLDLEIDLDLEML